MLKDLNLAVFANDKFHLTLRGYQVFSDYVEKLVPR